MCYIITLDKDKKESFKDLFSKNKKPLNGFEKGKDGHFYKWLEDPRCISIEEKRKELKEKTEIIPFKKLVETQKPERDARVYIHTDKNITLEGIRKLCYDYGFAKVNGNFTLFGPKLKERLKVPCLQSYCKFAKIEFNIFKNCVFFWVKESSSNQADYAIEQKI